jgi:ribosomal protein S7
MPIDAGQVHTFEQTVSALVQSLGQADPREDEPSLRRIRTAGSALMAALNVAQNRNQGPGMPFGA